MLKNIGLVLALVITTFSSYSCDVCGSSSLGSSTVYNLANQKMVGISYSNGKSSYEDRSFEEWSYKSYRSTIGLSSLWNISKTLQLEINVPFERRTRIYLNKVENYASLGDVQVGLNHFYTIGSDSTENNWVIRSSFLAEIPVVNINSKFENRMNMQTTSRSIDGIASLGILKSINNFSVYGNSKYKRSLVEYIDYRFGNTWVNEIILMYTVKSNRNISIIPQGGIFKELKRYDYQNNIRQHGTANNNTFAKLGFQINKNNWFIGADFSMPIYTKVLETGVYQKRRVNTFLILKF